MTQEIHLSQMNAAGTPTSHGAIMSSHNEHPHDHDHDHDHDLLTIDEAAGVLRTPKATLRYWRHLGTGRVASASAAASSTAPTTSTNGSPPNTTMTDPTSRENARAHGGITSC
jgi:hypothetical protein